MGVGGEVAPDTNKIFMEETNMKKIIATVLAMVMALALCTTAFAAETTTTIKKDGYSVANKDNSVITTVAADFTKTTKDNKVVTDSTGTTTTVYPACYKIDGQEYYVVDAAVATYKLIKDNAVVEYLTTVDLKNGVSAVVSSAVAGKASADDLACGDYATKDATTGKETPVDVYVVDGKAYVQATSGTPALLNGKVVFYGAEATAKDHVFDKKNTTTDNKGKIVSITCDSCKKSFTVVESGKVPANYAGKIDSTTLAGYVILLGSTTTTPAGSTGTTTSPKTFDAGIAMYVGMALTSVAGSAVVIGKKKEF